MVDTTSYMSEYIKADEITAGDKAVVIDEGKIDLGDYGPQLNMTVEFKGEQRKITINKTNAKRISEVFGTDTKAWIGKPFGMAAEKIFVAGKQKDTIVITPLVMASIPDTKKGCEHKNVMAVPGTDKGYCSGCGQLITMKL